MRVLITDGNERAALAAARSLVAARYEVFVSAPRERSLAGVSRGVTACTVPIDPLAEPQAYVAALAGLVEQRVIDILLPITDASVEAVLEYRAVFDDRVFLPLPSLEAYRHASDKALSLELARRAGLAVPDTVVLPAADWRDMPDPDFFPAVIKPHRSVVSSGGVNGGKQKTGVRYAQDIDACRAALGTLPTAAFPVLIQRQVHGPGEGLFLLRWDGRPIAAFAHRRLREKPPEGGVSVYRESIAPPAALLAAGTRLLELMHWQGVAMIECKRDLTTGRHVFMEVNGRLWGSLQLAIDAGINFPTLLMACALGATMSPTNGYRVGVRSRWFWGDVDNLYLRLKNGGDMRGKLAALREFLHVRRGRDREEIWRWRDPGPFLLESVRRLSLRS